MRVIFVSHLYPRCKRDYYLSRSKAGLSSAADAHQYAIALGLREVCDDFYIVNVPAVSHYPIRYKDLYQKFEVIYENGLTIHNVGYNNLIEYQLISRCVNTRKVLDKLIANSDDDVYIVLYGINIAINKAVVDIKYKYLSKIKICNIIPDLPQDIIKSDSILRRMQSYIHSLYFKSSEEYFTEYDSFVLLTKYMNEIVKASNDRFIVSEGVYEEKVTKRKTHNNDSDIFRLFYGGMMYEKFGIKNLVKAFCSINNPRMRLALCGYGDCVEWVKKMSEKDSRIEYLGILPREEVLELQSEASLLVNPRIPDCNPFTKYSFPSKTLEYFASGTPTLLYQLDGIPDEYYEYCYSLDSQHTGVEDLANKIIEISNISLNNRLLLAQKARSFVIENKNSKVVGEMIYELLCRT